MSASQTLWERPPGLMEPLRHLQHWSNERLHDELMPLLQPQRACTLIAMPGSQS